jgi:hypothetical protein
LLIVKLLGPYSVDAFLPYAWAEIFAIDTPYLTFLFINDRTVWCPEVAQVEKPVETRLDRNQQRPSYVGLSSLEFPYLWESEHQSLGCDDGAGLQAPSVKMIHAQRGDDDGGNRSLQA